MKTGLTVWLLTVWLLCVAAVARSAERPNIVFLLADDLRWNTLGCMGDRIVRTPHSDGLADAGGVFESHFVTTSICSVSRASILTGQHARRHGLVTFDTPFTPGQWANTYPARLRAAGYRTGFVGKWGIGDTPPQVAAMAEHFDFWRGRPGQAGRLFIDPHDPTRTHATAKMGDEAVEFLASCRAGRPFCLSVSFNAPHARDGTPREFEPDDRDATLYADTVVPVPPTATDAFFRLLPPSVRRSISRTRWELRFNTPDACQRTLRDYYRLVSGIDREVGRIRAALAEHGLAENTIIVLTSDNGFFFGERGLADKWYLYEESVRTPLVVHDPRLPAARRGRRSPALTLNIDVAPTLLDWAGVAPPAGMQGCSLRPLLEHDAAPDGWRCGFYYEHVSVRDKIAASEGIRTDRWTLIRWLDETPVVEELYDTAHDPLQERNVVADPAQAATLADLRAQIAALREAAE